MVLHFHSPVPLEGDALMKLELHREGVSNTCERRTTRDTGLGRESLPTASLIGHL